MPRARRPKRIRGKQAIYVRPQTPAAPVVANVQWLKPLTSRLIQATDGINGRGNPLNWVRVPMVSPRHMKPMLGQKMGIHELRHIGCVLT